MAILQQLISLSVLTVWFSGAHGQHVPTLPQSMEHLQQQWAITHEIHDMYSELSNLNFPAMLNEPKHLNSLQNSLMASSGSTPSACHNDTTTMITGLIERQTWAFQFVDAVGKIPSGIMEGDLGWLGAFSECRNITVPTLQDNVTRTLFRGQYCLALIGNTTETTVGPNAAFKMVKVGLCVPDSCNGSDTGYIIDLLLSLSSKTSDYGVFSVDCKPNDKPPLTSAAIGVIVLLCILGVVIIIGTGYDMFVHQPHVDAFAEQTAKNKLALSNSKEDEPVEFPIDSGLLGDSPLIGHQGEMFSTDVSEPNPGMTARIFMCFSVVTNGRKILTVHADSGQTLGAVHGIRFLSMSWVILGHALVFMMSTAMKNPLVLFTDYIKRFTFQAILNASVSVDSFFLLSGALASYLLLNQLRRSDGPRNINWAVVYFHRFWRLTPTYMLIIGIYTTLYHYAGSGPFFPETQDPLCEKNWWKNLLYINNFFDMSEMCVGWSWYLSNDMQFFIICPLIIIALYKFFVVGVIALCALIIMNIIVVWVLTQQNNFPADLGAITNATNLNDWMNDVYVKPYCRVGVYAVGLALGYLLHHTTRKPRLHWLLVLGGWLMAAACCLGVLYGLYGVMSGDRVLSHDVNALYASTHRIVWALGLSWVIFACSTGHGGPVNSLLSWSGLVPLSRLTYMAYLIHPIVIYWTYSVIEQPIFLSTSNIVYYNLGHLVVTYFGAFVCSVTLESPIMALEKLLLPRKYR